MRKLRTLGRGRFFIVPNQPRTINGSTVLIIIEASNQGNHRPESH